MGLDAGSVYATLGGKVNDSGFLEFQAQMKKSAAAAAELEAATASATKRMSKSFSESSASIQGSSARARASTKAWADINSKAAQSAETAGKAIKVGIVGSLVAVTAATGYAVVQAAQFERQMRNVNSIAKLSEPQFRKLSKAVIGLAGETAQAPKTLAEGMYQLVSSGFSAAESLKIIKPAAKAASAGLTDTATSVTALAGVLNAYHLPASKAAEISDILFQTVNRGVITFPELAHSIGTVIPFAASLGVPLRDVGAAISTLTKEGLPAATATTDLKNAMVAFLKPGKALTAAIKETGAANGAALVASKGFQGALEAVGKTTDGSKTAMQALFPNIRATAAVFDLTGKNAKTAEGDIRGFSAAITRGATDKVFAEQAKGTAFQFQQLKANVSAAAIVIGSTLLPILNHGAVALSKFLNGASKDGSLQNFAKGVGSTFQDLVQIMGQVVSVGAQVAGVLVDIGSAIGLGNASELKALVAAFAGFKVASFVLAPVLALGGAINGIIMNARSAPTLAAFFADLPFGPVGLLAGAVGALGAAFVLMGSQESTETALAHANADAHKAAAKAIQDQAQAELDAADKGLAAKDSAQALVDAKQNLAKVAAKYPKTSGAYKDALNAERDAYLRATENSKAYTKSLVAQDTAARKTTQSAADQLKKARDLQDAADQAVDHRTLAGRGQSALAAAGAGDPGLASKLKTQAAAQANVNARLVDYYHAVANSNVSDTNRIRLMNSANQVQQKYVQGISHVATALAAQGASANRQAQVLAGNTQRTLATAGALIQSGASQTQVIKVLADTGDAKSKLIDLARISASIPDAKIAVAAQTGGAMAALRAISNVTLRDKVARILGDSRDATSKIHALEAIGIPAKIARILANDLTAAGVNAAAAHLASLHDKSVTITETTVQITRSQAAGAGSVRRGNASGRGPIGAERSLVGEGGGPEWVVDPTTGQMRYVSSPTIMDLKPSDYVIPTESKYSGRAFGLLEDLAGSMGIAGYAAGRSAVNKKADAKTVAKFKIPPQYKAAAVDENAFTTKTGDARKAYSDREGTIHSLEGKLKTAHDNVGKATKSKGKGRQGRIDAAQAKLTSLEGKLSQAKFGDSKQHISSENELYLTWQKDIKELNAIKAKNQQIAHLDSVQQSDRQKMINAANAHDPVAYEAARTDRNTVLGQLRTLYQTAHDLATGNDPATVALQDKLEGNIQDTIGNIADSGATYDSTQADLAAAPEFTPAQQAAIDKANKDVALAALTTDLGDDTTAAGSLVSVLSGILNTDLGNGTSDATIADIAGQLKSAKDNLASLSGNGTNDNPDLQAQLDQANQRATTAQQSAATNAAVLAAFAGPGDIGVGGINARQAAINIFSPAWAMPSPQQAVQLAGQTIQGMGLQGSVGSPRTNLGL